MSFGKRQRLPDSWTEDEVRRCEVTFILEQFQTLLEAELRSDGLIVVVIHLSSLSCSAIGALAVSSIGVQLGKPTNTTRKPSRALGCRHHVLAPPMPNLGRLVFGRQARSIRIGIFCVGWYNLLISLPTGTVTNGYSGYAELRSSGETASSTARTGRSQIGTGELGLLYDRQYEEMPRVLGVYFSS